MEIISFIINLHCITTVCYFHENMRLLKDYYARRFETTRSKSLQYHCKALKKNRHLQSQLINCAGLCEKYKFIVSACFIAKIVR